MSNKFQLLARKIIIERDKSAKNMAHAKSRLTKEEQKLSDLEAYQLEYVLKLSEYEQRASQADTLYNYRQFLKKLEHITHHQKRIVDNLNLDYLEKQKIFFYHTNRDKTFQDYLERYEAQQLRLKMQKRQREDDGETTDRFSRSLIGKEVD